MPKIVSLHSFRRGTGKSSLTANLAVAIAQQGQRVGIIDADLPQVSEPDSLGVCHYFGVAFTPTTKTLTEVMLGKATLEETTWNLNLGNSDSGSLFLIPYHLKKVQKTVVLRELHDIGMLSVTVSQIFSELALDCLLIDIPAGLNEQTLPLLALSDVLLLVLSLDRPDFQGVAVTVDVARRLEIPQTLLAVNQVPPSIDLDLFQQEAEAIYRVGIAGALPWVEEMVGNGDRAVLSQHDPEGDFAQEVRAIAQQSFFRATVPQLAQSPPQQHRSQKGSSGLSLLDLLELPDRQRQLLNWMMRRPRVTLEEICKKIDDETAARTLLQDLLERGLIVEVETESDRAYQPAIAPKRGRQVDRSLWQALDRKGEE